MAAVSSVALVIPRTALPDGASLWSITCQRSSEDGRPAFLSASLISLGQELTECVCPSSTLQLWARAVTLAASPTAAVEGDFVFVSVRPPESSKEAALSAALKEAARWRGVFKVVGTGHPHGDVQKVRLILRFAYPVEPQLHFSHAAIPPGKVAWYRQDGQQWVLEGKEVEDREHALTELVRAVNGLLVSNAALCARVAELERKVVLDSVPDSFEAEAEALPFYSRAGEGRAKSGSRA